MVTVTNFQSDWSFCVTPGSMAVAKSRLKKVKNVRSKLHKSGTFSQQARSAFEKVKRKSKSRLQDFAKRPSRKVMSGAIANIKDLQKKHVTQQNAVEAVRKLQSKALTPHRVSTTLPAMIKAPTRPPPPPPSQIPMKRVAPKLPMKPAHLRGKKLK